MSSDGTWTEPPWSGWIKTTGDALIILEAARRGLIPRVTRRLVDSERKMISSGSVFVFDEEESGIKRWTDGYFWSPSRILGNFLLYRETQKKGASGHRSTRSDEEVEEEAADTTLSRPKNDGIPSIDKQRERTLMGSLTNSDKFKHDGLMKKTFSLSIGGVAQHLISYYRIEDVEAGRLRCPSTLPELASLSISPEYLDKTHFRHPPKVEIGIDGVPRYRGEADDIDTSSSPILPSPLSSGLPLLETKRVAKRFDPYPSPVTTKRPRKQTSQSKSPRLENATVVPAPAPAPVVHQAALTAPTAYPDPSTISPQYPPYAMPTFYPGYPPMYPPYHPPPGGAAQSQQPYPMYSPPPPDMTAQGYYPYYPPPPPPAGYWQPYGYAPQGAPQGQPQADKPTEEAT